MENSMKEYNECGYEVRQILDSFDFEGDAYKECDRLLNELEPYGYTFEYGLDGEPYNLKKLDNQFICGSCQEFVPSYTYSEERDIDECNACKTKNEDNG
tara:strand:- start:100 stop:396 length:297 start_codon:yes stop_codon:yes gene_type:complete